MAQFDFVAPELGADRQGRRRIGAGRQRLSMSVAELGRLRPRRERRVVTPARHHEPSLAIVGRAEKLEALEAVHTIDGARPRGETASNLVAEIPRDGDGVDLDIPVIMISALEEMDIMVRCIEMGADDYLAKPFNPVLLRARINSCLETKRLHDLEKEQKRILKETFGKYVAEDVRDEVLSGRIPLDGELKDVTVLFADLRNFTPLTESTPPKEVVRILNDYFTEMAPTLHRHHGSILRYVGDEIYTVFGAPLPLKDHPRHAVEAALDMRRLLVVVNEKLARQGYKPLSHGIGIHSGPVVAANIGSPDRLAYDLVGDTVNLASRIQELTKKFHADILISATTRSRLKIDFTLEKLPAITVKGKRDPVEIYRVI